MARGRKSKSERAEEWSEAKRRAWEHFRPRLVELATVNDAHPLIAQAPPPDTPARSYFSNFAFFISSWRAPGGANAEELALYADFVARLVAAGALAAERGAEINAELARSLEASLGW